MTYVFKIIPEQLKQLIEYYQDDQISPSSPYLSFMFQNDGITVSVFSSNKVTLQGTDAYEDYLMWSDIFGFEIEKSEISTTVNPSNLSFQYLNASTIGSDEVGTGDFYGPVIVVAAYISKNNVTKLMDYGVKDSKKLSDEFILKTVPQLLDWVPYQMLIVRDPKYNELVNDGYNLNKIKAYLHNHAILKIKNSIHSPVDYVIVDEFCSKKKYFEYLLDKEYYSDITFIQKAESVSIAVAVASMIARYFFLQEMDKLSATLGFELPKGAGQIVELIGKRIALEHGLLYFNNIAKLHFKNYERIKEMVK